MEKKQSSVEWLYEKLDGMIPRSALYNGDKIRYMEQAKAMHQKEHEDAFFEGAKCFREGQAWTDQGFREFSRILYNETFGNETE